MREKPAFNGRGKRKKYRKNSWEGTHIQIRSLDDFSKPNINFVRDIVASVLEMLGLVHE